MVQKLQYQWIELSIIFNFHILINWQPWILAAKNAQPVVGRKISSRSIQRAKALRANSVVSAYVKIASEPPAFAYAKAEYQPQSQPTKATSKIQFILRMT